MGMGRFKNGKFDLVIVANFTMTETDLTQWQRSFEKASELFWDASEGQLQYGRIFVCDESVGADTAEIILHDSGDPSYATWGGFGMPGMALHLMPYVKFQVLTHHHEMGHHVWALGEEYAADAVLEVIDTSVAPPDNATVPLVNSDFAEGELIGADAILKFGSNLERRRIIANTPTSLTVDPPFSQSSMNDTDGQVQYQFPAECATDNNARFCIMENSRAAAGILDSAGTWNPAANPVTEFCTNSNHDPDLDTQQEGRNGDSCWETIVSRAGYTALTAPDPGVAGPTSGFTLPEWILLDKQSRFAVMVDRSGSMSQGNKMAEAKHGADYWLEFCAVGTDRLAVVSYDDQIDVLLNLSEVSTLGGVGPTSDAINALTPRGSTNIRDALFQARDQIESLPTRAAVQVGLLVTDGIHNHPMGSSPLEALETYQEAGIRLYTLGVGQPSTVDMEVLNELASATGGRSFAVGDDEPSAIENAMIEINAEARGGIITTQPVVFPDSRPGSIDKLLSPLVMKRNGPVAPQRRPSLQELLDAGGMKSIDRLLYRSKRGSRRFVAIPVDIELDADRASFSIVHPDTEDVWLYVIDPNGQQVDSSSPGVHHVASSSPHEFVVVERPTPGRWLMIAVRARPGALFTGGAVAGGENRHLQAFASAPALVPPGFPVVLQASARWLHQLSGLAVRALITSPRGGRRMVSLSDHEPGRPNSGNYEGVYHPTETGRHHALVTVFGSGRATIADPIGRLLHSETGNIDIDPGSPKFVRQIVVSFEVGDRRTPKGTEEKPSTNQLHLRPTVLVSAKRRPLDARISSHAAEKRGA